MCLNIYLSIYRRLVDQEVFISSMQKLLTNLTTALGCC